MARRADHTHDEIREMAIDAAHRLIEAEGLESLKLRAIAREIGYAPGTLYNVFSGIDELMMHVNARTMDRLLADLQGAPGADGSPDLLRLLEIYGRFAIRNANLWRAVFEYSLADPSAAPDWYVTKLKSGLDLVEATVRRLAGPAPRHDPEAISRLLWAGLHGIFSLGAEGNLKLVSAQGADHLSRLFVGLIAQAIAPDPAS